MRGGVVLHDGTVVLPLGDIPEYRRVFVVRSEGWRGDWSAAISVASLPERRFEEPAPLLLRSGRILVLLRENRSRMLWQARSGRRRPDLDEAVPDRDRRLSRPSYRPARRPHPLHLRLPPSAYAIRATVSSDEGETWSTPIEIRSGLPNRDLGYPCTSATEEGLVTVYYAQDRDGCTCMLLSRRALPSDF